MKFSKSNNKAPLFSSMHIALLLLCAVLLSAYALGGLYARYTSSQTGGDDARVAKFAFDENLSAQSQVIPASLAPGDPPQTTTIQITNNGEVAIRCIVEFENLTNNLPIDCKIENQTQMHVDIAVGAQATFNLQIEWPADENSTAFIGKMDLIRVTVTVEQVD